MTVRASGFTLHSWQNEAVEAWARGYEGSPFTGTLEIFTGGGKTLIAFECMSRAASLCPDLQVAIVAPTEALVQQWFGNLARYTTFEEEEIGRLGGGFHDSLQGRRCLVCVLNSAAKKLPGLVGKPSSTMLIVDECHRAGAPVFSQVLNTPARFRLGLSATPDREELDEEGFPIEYDEHLIGQALGGIVYRFSLRDAREVGWLPDYEIHHHGIELSPEERRRYEEQSRRIDNLADRLEQLGVATVQARRVSARNNPAGRTAQAYVAAVSKRKDLLYRAADRTRVAARIVGQAVRESPNAHVLLFHERVREAAQLHRRLVGELPKEVVALEHSKLQRSERDRAIQDFREGRARVLVSVKSLVEGIDVPEADVGVSVASSSSVRQRVQSLGRVLRRSFDDDFPKKLAYMHILYAARTADEAIYGKEDWADLTGEGANLYWLWSRDPAAPPHAAKGPPRQPVPTEEQEWERLSRTGWSWPQPWHGTVPAAEYSVDARGNVFTPFKGIVANPQGVDRMVEDVRGRPGGRFHVTPTHRLVIVRGGGPDGGTYVAGRLEKPFSLREDAAGPSPVDFDVSCLPPGGDYPGPTDKENGTYKVRQARGGVIERRNPGSRSTEFALVEGSPEPRLEENARRVLEAWRRTAAAGLTFHVNSLWHAWYLESSRARYLADVPGGFAWPSGLM